MQLPGTGGLLASHPKSLSAVVVKDKCVKVCGPMWIPFVKKKAFNMRVQKGESMCIPYDVVNSESIYKIFVHLTHRNMYIYIYIHFFELYI